MLGFGLKQPGDRSPVERAVAFGPFDQLVELAADVGGRGDDVAALGAEVEVMVGQAPVALLRSGEVGMQAAAGVRV